MTFIAKIAAVTLDFVTPWNISVQYSQRSVMKKSWQGLGKKNQFILTQFQGFGKYKCESPSAIYTFYNEKKYILKQSFQHPYN